MAPSNARVFVTLPAAHTSQEDWPEDGLYVPAAHARHAEEDMLPEVGL